MASRKTGRARERRRSQQVSIMADKPFRRLESPFSPVDILSGEQVQKIHDTSMRVLEEIGIEFLDDEALSLWAEAGARVDHKSQRVWIDRGLLMELVSKAPDEFTLHARNPAHTLRVGGNAINFVTTGGTVYYSDLDNGRRPGTMEMFNRMTKLAQVCNPIHMAEGLILEPQDLPVPIRHLEKGFSQLTLSDKVLTTASHGREIATDYANMAAIVFGGIDAIRENPVFASVINANSPLRFDDRMLGGLLTYARYGQPPIITPFILAGAMSPITIAAAVSQQNAEALAGIALTQIVNPGTPVVYGGFTTNTDMQSGSPAFGTPEGAWAMFAGAQLARHYKLPYRGSGGLNNSKLPDAQASYETQMTLWPAVMAPANIILHSAGWLEAGMVCSLEKFIIDVEGLAVMHRFLAGVEISDETLSFDSIAEVGPGGNHFDTAHTMARYRSEFYQPLVSDRSNYGFWEEHGSLDVVQRANLVAKQLLKEYQKPAIDPAVEEALRDYVERRSRELGSA